MENSIMKKSGELLYFPRLNILGIFTGEYEINKETWIMEFKVYVDWNYYPHLKGQFNRKEVYIKLGTI